MMKKIFLLFILFVNLQISFVDKSLCINVQGIYAQLNVDDEVGQEKKPKVYLRECPVDGKWFSSEKDWNEHVKNEHYMMICPNCKANYRKGTEHKCDGKKKEQNGNQQQNSGSTVSNNIGGIDFSGIDVPDVPEYDYSYRRSDDGWRMAGIVITVTVPGWGQDTSGQKVITGRGDDNQYVYKETNPKINPNRWFYNIDDIRDRELEQREHIIGLPHVSYDWGDEIEEEEPEIKINENKKAPCPDDPDDFDTTTQPGAFEGAVMSELSYDNKDTRGDCKDKLEKIYDWEVADKEAEDMDIKLHDDETGLDCTLLKKPDGSGFVLAFAGTDPEKTNPTKANILATLLGGSPLNLLQQIANGFSSFSLIPDVKTDLYQWFYGMDPQYFQAMATAKKLTSELKKKYGENVKITFVGHSLGGGLASLASIVTGYPALTYNAAALSPMSKLELAMKGYNIDSSNIHRYSMETDPLTGLQFICSYLTNFTDLFDYSKYLDYNALGEEHEVKYDDDVSWGDKTNVIPFKNWKKNHSCVTIIDNLDCDEIKWSNKE